MKKKITFTLVIGFVSLISGLILAGIGFFSGGFHQLIEISSAEKVHQTFKNIDSIDFDTSYLDIQMIESEDQLFHVTYGISQNGLTPSVNISETNGLLSLTTKEKEPSIKGIMQFLGEQVSNRSTDNYHNTIVIKVPKGKTLKKLSSNSSGWSSYLSIENLTIEEVQLDNNISLDGATIHKGTINTGAFSGIISDSTLKNVAISGSNYRIDLANTTLEQSNISGYDELNSYNLTLIGDNHFVPNEHTTLTVTNLDLSNQSLKDLNLSLTSSLSLLSLAEQIGYISSSSTDMELEEKLAELEGLEEDGTLSYIRELAEHVGVFTKGKYDTLPVKTEGNKHMLIVEKKESKNKLSIETINGTINLMERK